MNDTEYVKLFEKVANKMGVPYVKPVVKEEYRAHTASYSIAFTQVGDEFGVGIPFESSVVDTILPIMSRGRDQKSIILGKDSLDFYSESELKGQVSRIMAMFTPEGKKTSKIIDKSFGSYSEDVSSIRDVVMSVYNKSSWKQIVMSKGLFDDLFAFDVRNLKANIYFDRKSNRDIETSTKEAYGENGDVERSIRATFVNLIESPAYFALNQSKKGKKIDSLTKELFGIMKIGDGLLSEYDNFRKPLTVKNPGSVSQFRSGLMQVSEKMNAYMFRN